MFTVMRRVIARALSSLVHSGQSKPTGRSVWLHHPHPSRAAGVRDLSSETSAAPSSFGLRLPKPRPHLSNEPTPEPEPSDAPLIRQLRQNSELDAQSAANELRWLREASPTHETLLDLVGRRAAGEPIQYILGTVDFGPLELLCERPVHIPRPETAHVFGQLARDLTQQNDLKILDLCTGSGCVALLMAHLLGPQAQRIWGVDVSSSAIGLAKRNLAKTGLTNVDFVQENLFSPGFAQRLAELTGGVDLIVANPPYLTMREWKRTSRSVREHEDWRALVGEVWPGDERGLSFYKAIKSLLSQVVRKRTDYNGPMLVVEVGWDQARSVRDIYGVNIKGAVTRRTEIRQDNFDMARAVAVWHSK